MPFKLSGSDAPVLDLFIDRPPLADDDELALFSVGLNSTPEWTIDNIEVVGNTVRFNGWIVAAHELFPSVFVNQRPCQLDFCQRGDLEAVFAHLRQFRKCSAFTAESYIDNDATEISFSTSSDYARHYYYSITANKTYPSPSHAQIERVNGPGSRSTFNRTGYSNYKKIVQIVQTLRPELANCSILDWGCGCGGLARFFLQDERFEYRGCDIDKDNLEWCQNNLSQSKFACLPLQPPSTSPFDVKFDVIFGISVVSHLSATNITRWLSWLSTLLNENGIIILSTLSTQALSKMQPAQALEVVTKGVEFFNDSTAIGAVINDQNYYGISFQTAQALAHLGPPSLRLSHHMPAAFAHQDVFVFRKA